MIFAVSPQNDVVFAGHKHKKKDTIFIVSFFLELMVGIEPTTCSLRVNCSAIEPHQHFAPKIIIPKMQSKVNIICKNRRFLIKTAVSFFIIYQI